MSHGHAIARNAVWLLVATTLQKVIAFLAFTLVARWAGAAITGGFFYAVSVTNIFVALTELGVTAVVIRELAADRARGLAALARALRFKMVLIPIAIAVTIVYAVVTGVERNLFGAILLACIVMSLDAVTLLFYGGLRGLRQLKFEAVGVLVTQSVTALISLAVVGLFHGGVYGLVLALIAGSVWNLGWATWQARRQGIQVSSENMWTVRRLAAAALPFALAGVFVKIYSFADTLFLKAYFDETVVGHYAVAYKVTYALQFLPLAFVAALYPSMSAAYAAEDHSGLRKILAGSLRLMLVCSVPAAATIAALAPRFIPAIYGSSYAASVAPLLILIWVLIPIFLDFPVGSLLNATHRAGLKTTAMGIAMVLNVGLNALLVPRLGAVGAAWSGLLSFSSLFAFGVWFARADFPGFGWLAWLLLRGSLVALLLFVGVSWLADVLPWVGALLLAGPLSLLLLAATRLVQWDDAKQLRAMFRRSAVV